MTEKPSVNHIGSSTSHQKWTDLTKYWSLGAYTTGMLTKGWGGTSETSLSTSVEFSSFSSSHRGLINIRWGALILEVGAPYRASPSGESWIRHWGWGGGGPRGWIANLFLIHPFWTIKLFTNRRQIRILNSKTTDFDPWADPGPVVGGDDKSSKGGATLIHFIFFSEKPHEILKFWSVVYYSRYHQKLE